mmetsp:Transcript_88580/g.253635  ORF Transcript_88580/g.253635 Transcript_88580/m.253635 type:complete len:278 (-) Transcript_88580:85-918(-)
MFCLSFAHGLLDRVVPLGVRQVPLGEHLLPVGQALLEPISRCEVLHPARDLLSQKPSLEMLLGLRLFAPREADVVETILSNGQREVGDLGREVPSRQIRDSLLSEVLLLLLLCELSHWHRLLRFLLFFLLLLDLLLHLLILRLLLLHLLLFDLALLLGLAILSLHLRIPVLLLHLALLCLGTGISNRLEGLLLPSVELLLPNLLHPQLLRLDDLLPLPLPLLLCLAALPSQLNGVLFLLQELVQNCLLEVGRRLAHGHLGDLLVHRSVELLHKLTTL